MAKHVILALLLVSSTAHALDLSGGPSDTLPEGGGCTSSGTIGKGSGITYTCTITSPGSFADVYFGIANNEIVNGMAMDGSGPSGFEIFRYSSSTPKSIVYTSTTTINNVLGSSAEDVNTRLVLTLTSGSGTVIDTGGTPANNGNGDIEKLFRITSASFAVNVDVSSNKLSIPSFGPANDSVFNPTHTPPSLRSMGQVDLAFYWNGCTPVNIVERGKLTSSNQPTPSQCLQLSGAGSVIRNGSNSFNLHWQSDGDLVLNNASGQAVWRSDTGGRGAELCFQASDGNFLIRDSSSNVVFVANTADNEHGGNGGELLTLGDDCNLTIVNSAGTVLFQTGTTCSSAPLATFTPTPTSTPLPSSTPTLTQTRTRTSTRTFTPTRTSTLTPSPTSSRTATAIPTSTPTDTPVPTSTPTDTPVPMSTATDTPVPTSTPSQTPLATSTATRSLSATATRSHTATSTPTATDTAVPVATPTDTPVPTSTPTETPTPSS
jgi:hypothetical protein